MAATVTAESPVQVKRRKYNRLMTEAELEYNKAVRAAEVEFDKITEPARKKFEHAVAPHQLEFEKTTKNAAETRDAAIAEAEENHSRAHERASKEAGFTS